MRVTRTLQDLDPERSRAIAADSVLEDRDWSKLPEGATRFEFDAPSGLLAGWSIGDPEAERVLLIPGATGSKEDFLLLAPLLAASGYRVHSVDLAGQYESAGAGPSATTGRWDYELYTGDLLALLRDEAGVLGGPPGPAHVLGYSFAGIIAQLVLADHPELVRSLTLLTCPPLSGQVFRGIKVIGPFTGLFTARQSAAVMLWGIRTNRTHVPPGRHRFVMSRFALTRRKSIDDIMWLMRNTPDTVDAVRATGVPVLIATGTHDLWPDTAYAALASRLDAYLAVYETGHSPCETTPHQLALDMVRTFKLAA